jgi:hypothetical protein
MLHHLVLVLAVSVPVSEMSQNSPQGGKGGGTTLNMCLLYQLSQVVPATFKPLCVSSLIIV